ncbi:hydroxyacylglutathione hydrolase [Basilea psittacipulmonis]|uniref:Hydroxyacylglutathione hydrolase n=1 Tax=Basilea psittacipulmonis DSM 24701 TaxID=1072685 RepID=A0A077DFV1_9BURK|nr:hydroxyacylglutathione hydrolase [Basilea psittacipulmonis]AIL33056.1 hypothetical protein IX83_06805 [Basilea psittacipulmonis DSM 24701]
MLSVVYLNALKDNYIWILHNNCYVYVVDPGQAKPVIDFLKKNQLELKGILITHHHEDHVGGVKALLDEYSVPVYGPSIEAQEYVTHPLKEGDVLSMDNVVIKIMDVPGHTLGHIAYFVECHNDAPYLFCGDTLFSAGCGRLFEGTPEQMVESLDKLSNLPGNTRVCAAHEYTLSNIAWAKKVEPNNRALQMWEKEATMLIKKGEATLPTTIALERLINPFLRLTDTTVQQAIQAYADVQVSDVVTLFAYLREWKNKG